MGTAGRGCSTTGAGRVGRKVALGGGELTNRMVEDGAMVDGRTARELLERCPGDYYLVSGHQ